MTAWMDPSVVDETDPLSVDPELDMFDPAHGPPYPPEFVERYRAGQRARNDRITAWVRAELERLGAAGAWDRLFNVTRMWADLRFADLVARPLGPRGRAATPATRSGPTSGPSPSAPPASLRSWLSMWSLEASQCQGAPHLARIRVPSLVVQSLADRGVFPSDAHAIHEALAADDKGLELVAGEHYFETGGRDEVADLLADVDRRPHVTVVAVTGSAGGIGSATRARLEAAGHTVIGVDIARRRGGRRPGDARGPGRDGRRGHRAERRAARRPGGRGGGDPRRREARHRHQLLRGRRHPRGATAAAGRSPGRERGGHRVELVDDPTRPPPRARRRVPRRRRGGCARGGAATACPRTARRSWRWPAGSGARR